MEHRHPSVRDVMVEDVHTVFPETLALWAADLMVRCKVRHLVVTDQDRKVVGVFTQRHVLKQLSPWLSEVTAPAEPPPRSQVREFMAKPPITVMPDTPLQEAAALLASHKIGCLPVVDAARRVVGILSSVDVLSYVARNHESISADAFVQFVPVAFLSEDGNLSLPKGYLRDLKFDSAVLAYAADSKRIGVKLFLKEKGKEINGARPVGLTDEHAVIPAKDFLDYHRVHFRGEFDVTKEEKTDYLVLSPRSLPQSNRSAPVPAKAYSGFPFRRS